MQMITSLTLVGSAVASFIVLGSAAVAAESPGPFGECHTITAHVPPHHPSVTVCIPDEPTIR